MTHIDIILEEMRRGGTVSHGSSRSHVDHGRDAEGFYVDAFDEGHTTRMRSSEARVRALYAEHPRIFAGLLHRNGWRRMHAALDADDLDAARGALEWVIRACPPADDARVWLAALSDGSPDESTTEMIRAKVRGHVLWHAIMNAFSWRSDAATAKRATWMLARLVERVSGIRGQAWLRERFAAMSSEAPGD